MLTRYIQASLFAAGISCLLVLPAVAGGKIKPAKSLSSADKDFLNKAALACMVEVDLGKIASRNAGNSDVKQLGEKMTTYHAQAAEDLKKLAASKNFPLPSFLGPADQISRMELEKLTGDRFDKEYMSDIVKAHKRDLSGFQHEADKGRDPDVKAFASKMLDNLKQDLDTAQQLEAKVDKGS